MNCNTTHILSLVCLAKFQSLIGILMNCNLAVESRLSALLVSIPNRDFDELQYLTGNPW